MRRYDDDDTTLLPSGGGAAANDLIHPLAVGGAAKRRRRQLELISQGSYGCVYRPALTCAAATSAAGPASAPAAPTDAAMVSKLQAEGRASRREVAAGARVARIPNYASRFAPVVAACPVQRRALQPWLPLASCQPLLPRDKKRSRSHDDHSDDNNYSNDDASNSSEEEDTFFSRAKQPRENDDVAKEEEDEEEEEEERLVLMQMPVAGDETLHAYLRRRAAEWPAAALVTRLAEVWRYLRDSLTLLVAQGLVHFDLKSNNVMYHRGRRAPLIIDFGLSLQVPELLRTTDAREWRAAFFTAKVDYAPWPPEAALCGALWQAAVAAATAPPADGGTDGDADGGVDAVVSAGEVARLEQVVRGAFQRHPSLQWLRRRAPDLARKKKHALQRFLRTEVLGATRLEASRRLVRRSWTSWDPFALAGALLEYLPPAAAALPPAAAAARDRLVQHWISDLAAPEQE